MTSLHDTALPLQQNDRVRVAEVPRNEVLKHAFGPDGDGHFWSIADWKLQQKYSNCVGEVVQVRYIPRRGVFAVVQFLDNLRFTFNADDLESVVVTMELTPVEGLPTFVAKPSHRTLTPHEKDLAERIFLQMMSGKDPLSTNYTADIARTAVAASVQLLHATTIPWNVQELKSAVLSKP